MADVKVRELVKVYGRQLAVRGIDLDIPDGAFVVLVGPSGCGKSTTLRMIAGLENISHGELLINGKRANDLPSRDRGVAMVFQTYALYPHLTVKENLAFSLKLAKVDPADMDRRIDGAIEALELQPYLDRRPFELSGGQRQRVAMGRAIVREPDVFLFDEPLSNLDAKLRNQMRVEIKRLQHRLGVTTIYVTHDQIEAMTLADVIVVMKDGEIAQQGTPLEVFESPANKFVASFIGSPQINFFDGVIKQNGENFAFVTPEITIPLDAASYGGALTDGQRVTGGLRPEDIIPQGHGMKPDGEISIRGEITLTELLGNESLLFARCGSVDFVARMQQPRIVADGENLRFHIAGSRLHLFDADTEVSLRTT
ncbi:MAG: sn-glycerol-3-phosphate ABC transporter ATP-binding protein UgpC [Tateyamaria sp.]|jgi:multiple sugar transport system ATP-binding protein|nr:sn-glycerol-3-phosphate ABC transporter ATP-binding protein UgpC [Alphaproteobacteria bacterium]MBT6189273.1 sn-glycerol-3-phosphate ABC transporter ATP-binding protein UgpC [Tateyamaria sp.]MDB3920986.1 sn-glycerol-3-phosphate ABC transporter ATP-binding protein UgpC [Paracoccaceae bacterium]